MDRNRCEVEATGLDEAGLGVGSAGGVELHVADLLPGERAEVALEHRSPHRPVAWAAVARRIGALSADRVAPACPAFGRCGGCTWQHLAYPAQLALKQARVAAALAAIDVTVASPRPAPAVVGYRNKGKYVAARHGNRLILGGYAPRTHAVVDTAGCRVVSTGIDEVASWVRGTAEKVGLEAHDEERRSGVLRYVVVRESHRGDILVALVVTSQAQRAALAEVGDAVARHPAVRSVLAVVNDRRDGAILPAGAATTVLAGSPTLIDRVGDVEVEVGAGEFFQVNREQATAMYRRVATLAGAGPGTRAVDLYAGVGGISFALAQAGAAVTAIELDASAAAALERAAGRAGLAIAVRAGDAASVGADATDVAIVNPPRKGLSAEARAAVIGLGAPRLVYVSCGPESLGRDLAVLAAAGYRASAAEPVDLMPGTSQIETIVALER
jgi:23S rRNA (uracil1939-C5)-methyltransferase